MDAREHLLFALIGRVAEADIHQADGIAKPFQLHGARLFGQVVSVVHEAKNLA